MNIDSLLEQIENILDSGTKITLSKKTMVNAEEIRECVEHLREIIPEEVDQAKALMKRFRCDHLADQQIFTMSSGEQVKILIARALLTRPELSLKRPRRRASR